MDSLEIHCLSISLRTDWMKRMITSKSLRCSGFSGQGLSLPSVARNRPCSGLPNVDAAFSPGVEQGTNLQS